MTDQGDFAFHHRDGDDVIKVLDGRHPAGARFEAAAQGVGVIGMNTTCPRCEQPESPCRPACQWNPLSR